MSQVFFSMGVTSADVMEQIEEWVTARIRESRENGQGFEKGIKLTCGGGLDLAWRH